MPYRIVTNPEIISAIQGVFNVNNIPNDTVTWSGSSSLTQSEGTSAGNYFIQLSATSSAGGTITYSKVSGLDSTRFGSPYTSGDNQYIALSVAPNFDSPIDANADNVYQVVVRATSSSGGTADRTFSITITDEVVTWTTNSNQDVYETVSSLALVATSTNSFNSVVFAITGGADAAKFSISGSNLTFEGGGTDGEFNYNSPEDSDGNNIYIVEVTAYTDTQPDGAARIFNITILEAFRITISNLSRFSGTSQFMDFTVTRNGSDFNTVASVSFNSSGTLRSASDLGINGSPSIQSVLNQAISETNVITVAVNAASDASTYIFDVTSSDPLVTNIVLKNSSQLYPTITLTEAKVTDGVTGVKDSFTLSATDVSPYSVTLNYGSFTFANDGTTILSTSPPSGFTTTASSGGSVTFTQDTGAPLGYTFSVSSGNGTIASQQDGVSAISGIAEVCTVYVGGSDGSITTNNGASLDSVGGTISTVYGAPYGYSQTSGGAGYNYVTFTANSPGVQTDETISSDGTGGAYITVDTQGVDAVTAVQAYVSINVTGVPSYDVTFNTGGAAGGTATAQGGVFTALTPPTNYTVTSGGTGTSSATLEQTTATTLGTRYAMATGGSYTSLSYNADGITEALEQHTITPTPVNPTGGTWKPAGAGTAVQYNDSTATIAAAINTGDYFGAVDCTVSGTLDAGAVTVTQGVGGGAPVADNLLSPVNVDLTAPAITVSIA